MADKYIKHIDLENRLHALCAAQRITAQDAIDIALLPAADVRPVVHARWLVIETERSWNCAEYPTRVQCSNCEHEMPYLDKGNFFPNCGAMMDADMREVDDG